MTQTLDSLIGEVEAGEQQHLAYEGLKGHDSRDPERLVDCLPRCWSA